MFIKIKEWVPYLVITLIFYGGNSYGTTQLTVNPMKRLEVVVALDGMNRIAMINDRITDVFGEEELYTIQIEEQKGQVFIRPLTEKNIALTLVTEGGITQDLTLTPKVCSATTLLLKSTPVPASSNSGFSSNTTFTTSFSSFQDQILEAMKKLILGQAPIAPQEEVKPRVVEGFDLVLESTHSLGLWRGSIYTVTNTTPTAREMIEGLFYQNRDLAINVQNKVLKPQESTKLTIIHYESSQ